MHNIISSRTHFFCIRCCFESFSWSYSKYSSFNMGFAKIKKHKSLNLIIRIQYQMQRFKNRDSLKSRWNDPWTLHLPPTSSHSFSARHFSTFNNQQNLSPRVFHSFFFGFHPQGGSLFRSRPWCCTSRSLSNRTHGQVVFVQLQIRGEKQEKTLLENCHIDLDQTPETYVLYIYTTWNTTMFLCLHICIYTILM